MHVYMYGFVLLKFGAMKIEKGGLEILLDHEQFLEVLVV